MKHIRLVFSSPRYTYLEMHYKWCAEGKRPRKCHCITIHTPASAMCKWNSRRLVHAADMNHSTGIGPRTSILSRFSFWDIPRWPFPQEVRGQLKQVMTMKTTWPHSDHERIWETLLQDYLRNSKPKTLFQQTICRCRVPLQTHMQGTTITAGTNFSLHHDHTGRSRTLPRVYAPPTPSEGGRG